MSDPDYRQAMLYLPYGVVHNAAFLGKMPEGISAHYPAISLYTYVYSIILNVI